MLLVVLVGAACQPTPVGPAPAPVEQPISTVRRDPWLRPFASTSIWNMPVGSRARYVDAQIPEAAHAALDRTLLVKTRASDPSVPHRRPGSWTNRCSGTSSSGYRVHLPPSWIVPDARQRPDGGWNTPNNVGAFLQPDGRTVFNTNGVARCSSGGAVFGYVTSDKAVDLVDLYGDGRFGSHGASRLSGLGGSIRPGELTGTAPIQHALDVVIWAKYLHYGGSRQTSYRWPAANADAYASPTTYRGRIPAVKMGALLALPPSVTPASLGIRTSVGQKLFAAMRDYGAYVTDDAAWDAHYLSVDSAAVSTFPWGSAEQADFNRIVAATHVVDNNAAASIGGGGVPRRPLLPPLTPPR